MNELNKEALDRHITGNYGEDQLAKHVSDMDEYLNGMDEQALLDRQRMEAEMEECLYCGCDFDEHREEYREDQYGNGHEFFACPPEHAREEPMLSHWVEFGCPDFDAVEDTGNPALVGWYCSACGNGVEGV